MKYIAELSLVLIIIGLLFLSLVGIFSLVIHWGLRDACLGTECRIR